VKELRQSASRHGRSIVDTSILSRCVVQWVAIGRVQYAALGHALLEEIRDMQPEQRQDLWNHHPSGLQDLLGEGIRARLTLKSQQSGHHDIAARAAQKGRAFFIGLLFQNRYDEDKALEGIQ
jgi:nucleotidyltransferase/DNA polymerase involved in DNA repair